MYEKCPCEENEQDQSITIFHKGEPIKVTADPKLFAPPDPNMVHTVTDNAIPNASQYFDKDIFLHDDMYVIDDEHPTKPQINLSQQQFKRLQYIHTFSYWRKSVLPHVCNRHLFTNPAQSPTTQDQIHGRQ